MRDGARKAAGDRSGGARRVWRALALSLLLGLSAVGVRAAFPWDAAGPTDAWLGAHGLTSRYAEVSGLRVRYVRRGSGPTVLLLHTLATSIYTWRDVLPSLAEDYDVVALDFPGFGASDQPLDLRAEIYPTVLAGLVARLGVPRVSVVGNGLGGTMGVIFAAFRPDRVERLALLNPTGFQMKLDEQPLVLRLGTTPQAMALAERFNLRRPLIRLGLWRVVADPARRQPQQIEEYVAPLTRPGAMTSIQSLLATYPLSAEQFTSLARRVRAPTLVMWGQRDPWMPQSHLARYTDAIPGTRTLLLPDCGHMPQEERPADVLAALRAFLGGNSGRTAQP